MSFDQVRNRLYCTQKDNEYNIHSQTNVEKASWRRLKAILIIIIIIMNFYSPVSNTRCHSIGHKMRIARTKIWVDSPGRWERA